MAISTGRLIGMRVALGVFIAATVMNAVGLWLAPRDAYGLEAGEPLTGSAESIASALGALALTWAVAAALALWKPFENRGL
ncbi:MAG: hypothetical protein FJ317_08425, partial [SAR202 cluster bacterium]|nr:hypothetical protein [SAR202 cluster bacterium]